jgi:hypothetical protein
MTLPYFMQQIEDEIRVAREKREDVNRRMTALIREIQRTTAPKELSQTASSSDP